MTKSPHLGKLRDPGVSLNFPYRFAFFQDSGQQIQGILLLVGTNQTPTGADVSAAKLGEALAALASQFSCTNHVLLNP